MKKMFKYFTILTFSMSLVFFSNSLISAPPCWDILAAESGKKESNNGKCYQDTAGEDIFLGWIKECKSSPSATCNGTVCDASEEGNCYKSGDES